MSMCQPAPRPRTGRARASPCSWRSPRCATAMTGEISWRALVLPVGGIKEKVVAAAAAGITRVMLPARNKRDYDDIPDEVRKALEFVWLEKVDDASSHDLQPLPAFNTALGLSVTYD